ncbi:MAG: hypothetical protein ACE5HW_05850 [Candidatus Methanofastidiosia archaeon]
MSSLSACPNRFISGGSEISTSVRTKIFSIITSCSFSISIFKLLPRERKEVVLCLPRGESYESFGVG